MVHGKKKKVGPVRDLNPGPLAPKARIIPLDQQALHITRASQILTDVSFSLYECEESYCADYHFYVSMDSLS